MNTTPILRNQQTLLNTDTPPKTNTNNSVILFPAIPGQEENSLTARKREKIKPEIDALEKRTKDGDIDAMNRLACLLKLPYINEEKMAEDLFIQAADAGNSNAMNNLGCLYTDKNSTLYDLVKGINSLKMSAGAGNISAMENLGDLYTNKCNTVYNLKEGIYWLEKAAGAGSIAAMYELGRLYSIKNTIVYDLAKSKSWIQKADSLENAIINNNQPRPFNKILERVKNTPWTPN